MGSSNGAVYGITPLEKTGYARKERTDSELKPSSGEVTA